MKDNESMTTLAAVMLAGAEVPTFFDYPKAEQILLKWAKGALKGSSGASQERRSEKLAMALDRAQADAMRKGWEMGRTGAPMPEPAGV